MSTWKQPSAIEVQVGLEIGAYAPAELDDVRPQGAVADVGTPAAAPRTDTAIEQHAAD
jgi:hypothetical protein